jgi:hypothetical protein
MSIKKTQQYVYRVEDRAGFGPYRNPRFWMHSWTKSNHDSKDHPSPKEDLQDSHREFQSTCWYCGFETLKSLAAWFSEKELRNLYNLGLSVKRVPVDRVWVGKKQVIFTRNYKKKNEVISYSNLKSKLKNL